MTTVSKRTDYKYLGSYTGHRVHDFVHAHFVLVTVMLLITALLFILAMIIYVVFNKREKQASKEYMEELEELNNEISMQNQALEIHKKALEETIVYAEHEKRSKNEILNDAAEVLEKTLRRLKDYANIAKMVSGDEEKLHIYLDRICMTCDELTNNIMGIIQAESLDGMQKELRPVQVSIPALLESLKKEAAEQAEGKHIQLYMECGGVKDDTFFCDKEKLDLALGNVLDNALKYTGTGGIVSVHATEKGSIKDNNAEFVFCVKDTGTGMSDDFLKRVFNPFSKEDNESISNVQGTGLGLLTARKAVEAMGGKITLKSCQGVGTEVTIALKEIRSQEKREL